MNTNTNTPACSCPSGDGSLAWPCPVHAPAAPQDERAQALTFFAYSPDGGFDTYPDAASARKAALDDIDQYRDAADDEWPCQVEEVCWGKILENSTGIENGGLDHDGNATVDYELRASSAALPAQAVAPVNEPAAVVRRALEIAEAALADIGDADREPGDDVAWCEQRAAQALPQVRAALAAPVQDVAPIAIPASIRTGISTLRWLLNLTTEFDRKDVRTRQAARLLDDYSSEDGRTNRQTLEDLWGWLQGTVAAPAAPQAVLDARNELLAEVLDADSIATSACQAVAELPDRNSPEDWPAAMLVTGDELHQIVREAVISAQPAAQPSGNPGEFATQVSGNSGQLAAQPADAQDDNSRLIEHAACLGMSLRDGDADEATESWASLPNHLVEAIEAAEARILQGRTQEGAAS